MSKLESILRYVSENNEFYKNRIKQYGITDPLDINQWPILTRKDLQENRYNMFSDGFQTKYYNQQLRRQFSSGSTGTPINVYWDYKDWYASNMCLWRRRRQWYGIEPSDRYVVFTLAAFEKEYDMNANYQIQLRNTLLINITMLHDDYGYLQIAKRICEFNPVWLYIQPTILNRLIDIYKEYHINPPTALKYIESVGEVLTFDLRNKAQKFFNVVIANMYGSEEMNSIAYECPNGHMHILEDNVFLERDSTTNAGIIRTVVSSLNNKAMPLIRYDQEDRVLLGKAPICKYDSSPVIEKVFGRIYETIKLDDFEVNGITLKEIIAEVNNEFNDSISVYKFDFNQINKSLICYIKMRDDSILWFTNVRNAIEKAFNNKIPTKKLKLSIIHKNDLKCSNSKQLINIAEERE